jgi:dUTP pyrophosphatase
MERKLFKTGLSIAIPQGMYGRIAPRSGLAYKDGIDVLAGVIDEDYRGDVGVILINFGTTEKQFKIGDRIAQIIFEFYNVVNVVEVKELDETVRSSGGWGSTDTPITGGLVSEFTPSFIPITNRQTSYINYTTGTPHPDPVSPSLPRPKETPPTKNYESQIDLIEQWKKAGGTTEHPSITYEKLMREREKSL